MSIASILIGIALLVIVVALVVSPLLEGKHPAIIPPSQREALELEHQNTLRAIREIDLDYRTHKLNDEDYKVLRTKQVEHGAQILRELDALKSNDDDIDTEIEAQIAALRQAKTDASGVDKNVPVQAAQGACPKCGLPVKPDDKFCAHCGTPLEANRVGEQS